MVNFQLDHDGTELMLARMLPRSLTLIAVALAVSSCGPKSENLGEGSPVEKPPGELLRIGSVVVDESELAYQLKEKHDGRGDTATRDLALAELAERARITQAALDAGIDDDPVVRAEYARLLAARHRETVLNPKLKQLAVEPIPEVRLREIYEEHSARFRSEEKRQVALLWLDPGPDPARVAMYTEKLAKARDWFLDESGLADQPEKGFSVLAVDHSVHAATRFKGGVFGWIEKGSGTTGFDRALGEIAFSLGARGEVSPVIGRAEGIFLVRLMDLQPARQRSFESVRTELERGERSRLRKLLEEEFAADLRDS